MPSASMHTQAASWVESPVRSYLLPHSEASTPALFPTLPTLLATQLHLELLLQEQSVDLAAAAGVILNDLGATLEIFRRAREENAGAERIEDCLASLGTDAWLDAVCGNSVERVATANNCWSELTAFWEHGRLLAYACWFLASRLEGYCPEEAYLVGLLHEADKLPALLRWAPARPEAQTPRIFTRDPLPSRLMASEMEAPSTCHTTQSSTNLATHWRLPAYLQGLLAAREPSTVWDSLLDMAHAWSRGEECLLGQSA